MAVVIGASFFLGQKIEKLETLNENITTYMETYDAERFVNLERDIKENKDDIASINNTFRARVVAIIRSEFIDEIN